MMMRMMRMMRKMKMKIVRQCAVHGEREPYLLRNRLSLEYQTTSYFLEPS
jgi:hypothetical protein